MDLAKLLAEKPDATAQEAEATKRSAKLEGKVAAAVKAASVHADLTAALGKKVSRRTPNPVPNGGLFLQPTDERRRSGSHYTPRSLTEPIVETTLEPILEGLGDPPTPDADPRPQGLRPRHGFGRVPGRGLPVSRRAPSSRAGTLTAACRQIPPDEDPLIHARRLVAARCLYGVDKNPFAVDLAKLSLWLATLAHDHPFTFLDHALRHGDSLVGLTREQIACFHWETEQDVFVITDRLGEGPQGSRGQAQRRIHALGDAGRHGDEGAAARRGVAALDDVRDAGDLVIAAFFGAEKPTRPRSRSASAVRS